MGRWLVKGMRLLQRLNLFHKLGLLLVLIHIAAFDWTLYLGEEELYIYLFWLIPITGIVLGLTFCLKPLLIVLKIEPHEHYGPRAYVDTHYHIPCFSCGDEGGDLFCYWPTLPKGFIPKTLRCPKCEAQYCIVKSKPICRPPYNLSNLPLRIVLSPT